MRARITTLPCCSARQERHRRARHHVRDRREVLGRGRRGGDEAGDRVRRRRQDQEPAHDLGQGMEPELEAGHHAEVAAAAADRPEQVRVPFVVDLEDRPVRGHDLGGQQAVDRQPVLADEVADAAARRDPAEPDRAGVAEAGGEAALGRRRRVARPPSARCRPTPSSRPRRSRGHRGRGRRARSRPRRCCGPPRCDRRTARPARDRCLRASAMTVRTSSVSATRTISAGRASTPPSVTVRASS